jgi:hypothetical protein
VFYLFTKIEFFVPILGVKKNAYLLIGEAAWQRCMRCAPGVAGMPRVIRHDKLQVVAGGARQGELVPFAVTTPRTS